MAIDYSQRPKGTSKREWWAQQTGGSKYDYPGMSDKKENSESSYKPKKYDYKDLVDTSGLEKAYGEAKSVYTDQLTALKPRYEELYKQLQAEKELAMEKESALSAEEIAQQKRNIAKRGVSVDTDNPYYTTEAGKLQKEQLLRSKETALDFEGSRLDIAGAESADTRDFTTAIANLDLSKANTISSLISSAKTTAAGLNQQEADRVFNDKWNRISNELAKSENEKNRALQMYKISKDSADAANDKSEAIRNSYNNSLATLVNTAYLQTERGDYSNPNQRERIINQLQLAYPDLSKEQIANDVAIQMPNGWESSELAANPVIQSDDDGETYVNH